jgi:peptide/nickel transport system substrate-binding protein
MASVTLATAALGGATVAQSEEPASGPDLFNSTYATDVFRPAPEARRGGTVIVADWQEANLFNPYYYNNVTEADVNSSTQAGLVTQSNDFKYVADLAVAPLPTTANGGVTVNDDGTMTVKWTLRDGLMWSDGQPLTCDDFAFTNTWVLDAANVGMPAGKSGYLTDEGLANYAETGAVTDEDINLTVTCNSATDMQWDFKEVYEGYLTLIPNPLPAHYMSSIPIDEALTGKGYLPEDLPNAPVSGPFKYQEVVPGQQLTLAKNENYKDALTGEPAYLDTLIFKWYADADAMIAAFQGAEPEYDVAKDLNDADIPKLLGADGQPNTDDDINRWQAIDSLTYEFLRPNWRTDRCSLLLQNLRSGNCVMSDPSMREALKFALDKGAINERLLGGNAAIAYTNTSPSAWFYVAPSEVPTQDLERAAQILTDAGWVTDENTGLLFKDTDGDGVKDYSKGDYDATIDACTTTRQVRQDTLAMVSGFMNQIGVQVTIVPVSSSDIFASYNESTDQTPCALSRSNFDLAEHAFSVPLDPLSNYPVYHSSQFEPQGQNDGQVNDPAIDEALANVKNTADFSVVLDNMATFQQLYQDNTVEVPLYYRKEVNVVNPRLRNFTGNPTNQGPMWNVQHWFLGRGGGGNN